MTSAEEDLILAYHDAKLSGVPNIGRVIPAPLHVEDKREFLSTWDETSDLVTQKGLETELLRFVSFGFSNFSDDQDSPAHSPIVTLNYSIYLFSEYDVERVDEEADTDTVARRNLKRWREFVGAVLAMKEAYQGDMNIGTLDTATWARAFSRPLVQVQQIETQAECEFVPGVIGMAAKFEAPVVLKTKEC